MINQLFFKKSKFLELFAELCVLFLIAILWVGMPWHEDKSHNI